MELKSFSEGLGPLVDSSSKADSGSSGRLAVTAYSACIADLRNSVFVYGLGKFGFDADFG